MKKKCTRQDCRFVHDTSICVSYWTNGSCKYGKGCRKKHILTNNDNHNDRKNIDPRDQRQDRKKKKNTECFVPMDQPTDIRVVYDLGKDKFNTELTTRDVLLAPNIFSDYENGELYKKLVEEIESCTVPKEDLLKLWHGNEKIEGTHLIANDRTRWKDQCPTFNMILERLKNYFNMDIKATRFNWYQDTSHWKPFHFDSSAVNPEKAAIQNFTVAVSFGVTRDAAFEHARTKTTLSIPQPDGCVYAFAKDTNVTWRHGILQDLPVRQEGRISVIAWGSIPYQKQV